MPETSGQDEARDRRGRDFHREVDDGSLWAILTEPQRECYRQSADRLLALWRAPSLDRGAEEWNYDMEAAPKGSGKPVLVSVPSFAEGHGPFVGEAYYHEGSDRYDSDEGWWWAGTSPGDYYASPIREVNAEPIAWRNLPAPAALAQQAKGEGGGE